MNLKFIKSITLAIVATLLFWGAATAYSLEQAHNQVSINPVNGSVISHVVAKGETVYSIANKYGLPVDNIYQLNPSSNSGIRIGETLIIPKQPLPVSYDYTVKPKETLYSISREFGVSVDDIISENPVLKTKSLREGQIIKIVSSKKIPASLARSSTPTADNNGTMQLIEHKVASKETIYGISKKYGTAPETLIAFNPQLKNSLIEGSTILVPVTQDSLAVRPTLLDLDILKIGIILPFVNQSQGQAARFLEYYEGLLLSLEEMKAKGFSAHVFVFDMGSETGTAKLNSLLETNELKNLDLIIGGISVEQIEIISKFTKANKINYVIPFPTSANVVESNPYSFQVNETQVSLIRSVAKAFSGRFSGSNVIFVTSQDDKKGFIADVTAQLSSSGIFPKTVSADNEIVRNLSSALDPGRRNVIVVASGSLSVLQSVIPALDIIRKEQPLVSLTLFGQPEWQTYSQYVAQYGKYDTYIYTSFFLNENDAPTQTFMTGYKSWYNNKSMINTYPKYAALGYDTGLFFFDNLLKFGNDFGKHLSIVTLPTIQTPFSFKRTSQNGGYLNTGFYFVHYGSDGYIQKIAYAQW